MGDGMNYAKHLAILAVSIFIGACGGGGGSSSGGGGTPPPAVTSAEGIWQGTTDSNRGFETVVLDDGTFWTIYTLADSDVIAGLTQGTSTASNGSFSTSGKDINFAEGFSVSDFTGAGTYTAKSTQAGTNTYSGGTSTFTASYDTDYDLTPSLATIAGTYAGEAISSAGNDAPTSLTVSGAGAISGSGVSGCTFTGSATPRATGNVYNLSLTFGGAPCANGTDTVTGVAFFDATSNELVGIALNSARTNGIIYQGTKVPPRLAGDGAWAGTVTGTTREIYNIVLNDGTYYGVYSLDDGSGDISGMFQGTYTSGSGSSSSLDGVDINFAEGFPVDTFTSVDTYIARTNRASTATYTVGGFTTETTTTYDIAFDLQPSLETIAGTYTGEALTSASISADPTTFTISGAGAISGSGTSGCTFTGSATPRTTENVYNVSFTFGGGTCINGTSTLTGVAVFNAVDKEFFSIIINSTRTDGAIYEGEKP